MTANSCVKKNIRQIAWCCDMTEFSLLGQIQKSKTVVALDKSIKFGKEYSLRKKCNDWGLGWLGTLLFD